MALGKLTQDNFIEKALNQNFPNRFSIEFPFVFIENDEFVFHLIIETSNLGRTSISQPLISYKEINSVINPFLDKFKIIHSKWSQRFTYPIKWKEDLTYLHSDSEEEMDELIEKLIPYINEFCIPFWEKFKDTKNVLSLIKDYSEQELNQGIFQGVQGIMKRLVMTHNLDYKYYKEKKDFYNEMIKSYSEKKPEHYENLYLAFKELTNFLDKKN